MWPPMWRVPARLSAGRHTSGWLHEGLQESPMTAHERANLVLAFAKSLYVNGQATDQMVDAVKRLGRALGLRITIIPRWDELQLVADSEDAALAVQAAAAPRRNESCGVDDAGNRGYRGGSPSFRRC